VTANLRHRYGVNGDHEVWGFRAARVPDGGSQLAVIVPSDRDALVRVKQVVESAPAAGIGVVVDHDDLGATQVELLHGAQPDTLQAAHDDVTLHAVGSVAVHPRHVLASFRHGGCCSVKCRPSWPESMRTAQWGCGEWSLPSDSETMTVLKALSETSRGSRLEPLRWGL